MQAGAAAAAGTAVAAAGVNFDARSSRVGHFYIHAETLTHTFQHARHSTKAAGVAAATAEGEAAVEGAATAGEEAAVAVAVSLNSLPSCLDMRTPHHARLMSNSSP